MNNYPDARTYYDKMHRLGKWMTFITLIVFCGVPFVVCMVYGIMPKISDVLLASGGLLAIFIPAAIAELIADTPVMGTSFYLSSITGNIMNLKLPAVLNALKIADVKQGTQEADAVSGVAVAVSSLTTMIIIAIGALLLTPLKPILELPQVVTATQYVLPALFGCLMLSIFSKNAGGGTVFHGHLKALIIPFIIAAALYLYIIPEYYELYQGFIIIGCIPLLYAITKIMYKKGMIKVEMKEEQEGEERDAV
ncbi:MAG: hypothetical protein ACLRJC_08930 [Emergencia timonensis]|uniref:hypothetical protein n=1 Tax=Emergencia timonensis TaxID=1776384 RepID=UPI00082F3CAB|nr:hypothetical protein [Emergencia timonensis]WNX88987.1 hypothetical protein RVY71_01660 [Emergencia timonensis]